MTSRPGRRGVAAAVLALALVAACSVQGPASGARSAGAAPAAIRSDRLRPVTPAPAPAVPFGAARWITTAHRITVGGSVRNYLMVRPPDDGKGPMPVVVVLHGRGMTPATMQQISGFVPVVGRAILVYPVGYGASWNAGACCGPAHAAGTDDVSFIVAVVHQVLDSQPDATAGSVFLVGYSNGGRMAYRMACAAPGLFAGVASVEAVSVYPCATTAPVSLIEVASTADPLLSINHAEPPKMVDGLVQPWLDTVVADWRHLDGCPAVPTSRVTGALTTTMWASCSAGTRVALSVYRGGSHAWPDGGGPATSAARVIWDFLVSSTDRQAPATAAVAALPQRGE